MKKILVLSGVADCGKTSTLLIVIEELKQLGCKLNIIKKTKPRSNPNPDITAIIELDQTKIVIVTIGDAKYLIERELIRAGIITTSESKKEVTKDFFKILESHCDILICASRSKGETISFIENIAAKNNISIEIIKKAKSLKINELNDNTKVARQIVKNLIRKDMI